MTTTQPTEARTLKKPSFAENLRWSLTMGLSLGIGMTVARNAVDVLWPELRDPWLLIVRIVAAGLACGLVAFLLEGLLGVSRRARPTK
jgi:hypothetical protein